MHLLLVDADPQFTAVLVRVIATMRPTWSVRTAPDAAMALTLLSDDPADVVACAVRGRPDDRALLESLCEVHPGAIRIALMGDGAREDALRIATLSHRQLDRPCTGADLVATAERAHALRALLDDPALQAAVGGMAMLPTPPETLLEFESELADPATTMERLATVIERDPGASAAVIRMANISLFRRAQDARTVLDALRSLGTQLVRGIVITHAVASRLAPAPSLVPLEQWQERSLLVAGVARDLARRLARIELQREAFIAGLLHDVGTIVLASSAPETLRTVRSRAVVHGEDVVTAMRGLALPSLGAIGAYLLALWGLPSSIVEAVAGWPEPSRLPGEDIDAAIAVHVADTLVDRPGFAARAVEPGLLAGRRRGAEVEAWMAATTALNA
jgi:HD-like signal output (HDOD) protein